MDFNEFFASSDVRTILEDAFMAVVDGAGTVRVEDGGLDADNPDIQYVSIKDLDLEAHIGLSPLGAFTLLRGHDALSMLALLYAVAYEEDIAADGGDASAIVSEMHANLTRKAHA
jgi:hypothetical protein